MVMATRSGKGKEDQTSQNKERKITVERYKETKMQNEMGKISIIQKDTRSVKIKQETIEDSVNKKREQKLITLKTEAYGKSDKRNLEVIDLAGGGSKKREKVKEINSIQQENKKIPVRTSKRRIIGAKYPKSNKKYYQDIREYAQLINKESEPGDNGRTEEDKVVFLGKQKSKEAQQKNTPERLNDLISQVGIDSLQFEEVKEEENCDKKKVQKEITTKMKEQAIESTTRSRVTKMTRKKDKGEIT